MASFNFTDRLETGKNSSRSINAILTLSSTALSFRCIAGADSTSAAVDLTAPGALATDRIVAVIDLTTQANLSLSLFTPGADKITQAIGHDLDASSLLFVILADETSA